MLEEYQEYGFSDAFGVIRPRARRPGKDLQLSKATNGHPEFVKLVVQWAMKEFDVMKTFPFTTFTING